MDKVFQDISANMVSRYSTRYHKLGYDVTTLGWGDEIQQVLRFSQTLDSEIFIKEKSILDIGCGFGDYYDFLMKQNVPIKKYKGFDVNPDLIAEAQKQHLDNSETSFEVIDIIENNKNEAVAEIGVMLGVLNLNLAKKIDNYEYSKKLIQNAFSIVEECLIVDFLSNRVTPDYPKEEFVFYHDPLIMLDFALTMSLNVVLKHDYLPIPQKEFMLFIYK